VCHLEDKGGLVEARLSGAVLNSEISTAAQWLAGNVFKGQARSDLGKGTDILCTGESRSIGIGEAEGPPGQGGKKEKATRVTS